MSKFYFENQGNGTYLVYPVGSDEQVDALTLGMLTNNSIKNFAPVVYTQQDQEKYIKYNVTTRISVQQMLMSPVNKKQLLGLLTGIAAAVSDAEEYMIDVRSILFDTNYIFADTAGETTVMICLPVIEEQTQLPDMKLFFKELLFSVSLNPEENNDYFVQMINYLNKETSFSIEAFSEFLKKLSVEAAPMIQGNVQTPARQENMQPQASQVQTQPQTSQGQAQPRQNQPQAAPGNTYRPQPQVPQSGQPVMQAQKPQAQNQPVQAAPASGINAQKKEMSWFYLMQHYNKENAALYKSQKEQKKQEKKTGKEKGKKQEVRKNPAGTTGAVQTQQYAVPGASGNVPNNGITIPGNMPANGMMQNRMASVPQNTAGPAISNAGPNGMTSQPAAPMIPQGKIVEHRADFGETTVLGGGMGETTVLSEVHMQGNENMPYLIREKNSEKIPLSKPVFRIGKEKSYVDYFIGDNTAVSRSHANIITREGRCFILDTNSTNHTYVNGVMIRSNEEVVLSEEDKIRLANEEFVFHG